MHGTIRSRPTHYEVLGVSPAATSEELARAFASRSGIHQPHAFGALAELCVAYETLKDPSKRTAYDASIGLTRKHEPRPLTAGARWAAVAQGAVPAVHERPLMNRPPPAVTKPALPLGPGEDSQARPEPRIGRSGPPRLAMDEFGAEARPVDWRKAGIALAAVVIAACTLGGFAGWWSAGDTGEGAPPENSVSLSLPPATPLAAQPNAGSDRVSMPTMAMPKIERRKPAMAAASGTEREPTASEPAPAEPLLQVAQAEPSSVEPADPLAPATATASTTMPLPNRVIARTIQRIGYSCGNVTSTEPVDGGASGVFKVTCSSGQSYQASPVSGRYRFRRWGRR